MPSSRSQQPACIISIAQLSAVNVLFGILGRKQGVFTAALLVVMMLWFGTVCAEELYDRAVDAISDAIFRAWFGGHKGVAERSAAASRSVAAAAERSVAVTAERSATVKRSAPVAAAAAAAVDDTVVEEPVLTPRRRGFFARFKRKAGTDKKENKRRASLLAPLKRVSKRRPGFNRTESNSSGVTIPLHVDDDVATGEVHPAVAAALANMAAHRKLAQRASPPPASRSNGLQGMLRKATARRV